MRNMSAIWRPRCRSGDSRIGSGAWTWPASSMKAAGPTTSVDVAKARPKWMTPPSGSGRRSKRSPDGGVGPGIDEGSK